MNLWTRITSISISSIVEGIMSLLLYITNFSLACDSRQTQTNHWPLATIFVFHTNSFLVWLTHLGFSIIKKHLLFLIL